jgi:hypothetical protein
LFHSQRLHRYHQRCISALWAFLSSET